MTALPQFVSTTQFSGAGEAGVNGTLISYEFDIDLGSTKNRAVVLWFYGVADAKWAFFCAGIPMEATRFLEFLALGFVTIPDDITGIQTIRIVYNPITTAQYPFFVAELYNNVDS